MTTLPTPKGWRFPIVRAVMRYVMGAVGVAAILAGLLGLALARQGVWIAAVGVGVMLVGNVARIGPFVGRDGVPLLVTADGETGVELPFSRVRVLAGVVNDVGLAVIGAGVAFIPLPEVAPWPLVFGSVFVALGGWPAYRTLSGAGHADPGLVLTPDGLTYAVGHTQSYVPWERVRRVRATSVYYRLAPTEWFLTIDAGGQGIEVEDERRDGVRRVDRLDIAVDPLAVDPIVAYWAVHHYATHAADRAELADRRGVDRILGDDLSQAGRPRP